MLWGNLHARQRYRAKIKKAQKEGVEIVIDDYDIDEKELNLFLQGDIMMKINQGIYTENLLPQGQIAICHNTKINETDVKMLVVGDLSKDYEYFYKGII